MKVLIPAECAMPSRDKEIVCQENRCKITFVNKTRRKVIKYGIDGCPRLRALLQDPQCKLCDFLLVVESRGEEHYIELKGKNVKQALNQLESTIRQLRSVSSKSSFFCWIIATESPRATSKFQNLKLKFERQFHNATLKVRTFKYEHDLA